MVKVHLKVVLVGHTAVGKTTLVDRFVNGFFDETRTYQITIGCVFAFKKVEIDDMTVNMGIWDAGGEVNWEEQVKKCYSDANAVIVCYDASEVESFKKVRFWLRELRRLPEECKLYVCATKSDLLDSLNPAIPDVNIVTTFAKQMNAKFFLTSSKTGENVDELFKEVANNYLQNTENIKELEQMEIEDPVYYGKRSSKSTVNNCGCFGWIWSFFKKSTS